MLVLLQELFTQFWLVWVTVLLLPLMLLLLFWLELLVELVFVLVLVFVLLLQELLLLLQLPPVLAGGAALTPNQHASACLEEELLAETEATFLTSPCSMLTRAL